MSDAYRPYDQAEKLGPSPWSTHDPRLIAWEGAHGHDVRLKCLPEFGCLIVDARTDEIEDAAREVLDARAEYALTDRMFQAMERLRRAVEGEETQQINTERRTV